MFQAGRAVWDVGLLNGLGLDGLLFLVGLWCLLRGCWLRDDAFYRLTLGFHAERSCSGLVPGVSRATTSGMVSSSAGWRHVSVRPWQRPGDVGGDFKLPRRDKYRRQ